MPENRLAIPAGERKRPDPDTAALMVIGLLRRALLEGAPALYPFSYTIQTSGSSI